MESVNTIGLFIAIWLLLGNIVLLIDAYLIKTIYASSVRIALCILCWPIVLTIRVLTSLKIISPEE